MKIKRIHVIAVLILAVYYSISKMVFITTIVNPNLFVYFFGPYFFGATASVIFLYVFSHEEFFSFAKEIEKKNMKKEKKLLHRFKHHGKIASTLAIATVGGPVFSALTTRLLLNNFRHKYLLVFIGNIPATILGVGIAKVLFHIVF